MPALWHKYTPRDARCQLNAGVHLITPGRPAACGISGVTRRGECRFDATAGRFPFGQGIRDPPHDRSACKGITLRGTGPDRIRVHGAAPYRWKQL